MSKQEFTFFGTAGDGQPGFPGYLRVTVRNMEDRDEAMKIAYQRMNQATNCRWCRLYDSLDRVHELDKHFRGEA